MKKGFSSQKRDYFISLFLLLLLVSCNRAVTPQLQAPALFNDDWQFILSADSTDVFNPNDTLAWENVSLPHTPRIEPLVVNDQWQGICWYKKKFLVPSGDKGKRFFLQFDGAMNVADVWINGVKKIHHLGGFLPFTVDFTQEARTGGLNEVIVRLDNTDNPITGPKPLKQLDFNTYGGLYRDAHLIVKNAVYITDPILENDGRGGILVTYPEVNGHKAVIHVRTQVKNSGAEQHNVILVHTLLKGEEELLRKNVRADRINPGDSYDFDADLVVRQPALWSPSAPNLYKLVTLVMADGDLVDADTTRIGIRRYEFLGEQFAINGESMFLRGVNRHQEYPYIGYALSDEAQYRDARKIKEAGFDYVRLSHYPQSPAFMDACDELGLVALDAIPGWQYYNDDPAFRDQVIQTCHDMIRRDRNHPCVLAWEVSLNETWMPEEFIDRAIKAAREEYPGDQCFTAGWINYGYDIFLQARQHRLQHYGDPGRPYIVSEYGDWEYYAMNAGLKQDQWKDLLPDERSSRQPLTAGEKRLLQQATNIEEAHNDNLNTPAFADGYWAMFDYNRGYTDDLETSGIMSIFRLPKFSYDFFRSQRDPQETSSLYTSGPMVSIASYWDELTGPDIRIFSNCEEVELSLNGQVVARRQPDTGRICNNLSFPPFTFHLEKFVPGTLVAAGIIDGEAIATDTVTTPGPPALLRLKADISGREPKAGVNDQIFIHALIADEDGNPVHINDIPVSFSVTGDAVIIDAGSTPVSKAGIASALLKIGRTPGDILITATADNLGSSSLKIKSY